MGLKRHISKTQDEFVERAGDIVDASIRDRLGEWLLILPDEVEEVARGSGAKEDLLESFMLAGLIPKYAFPVDVVKLANPEDEKQEDRYESRDFYSGILRDLRIALSEYAPGAEIILGRFPDTFTYRSAAVYDPSAHQTDYMPHENLNECGRCRSVTLTRMEEEFNSEFPECGSNDVISMPYLRPRGFTVDAALPEGGREAYRSGGRERAGFTPPAQLLVGANAVTRGQNNPTFAKRLYSAVHVDDLFVRNMGPDLARPGFVLCPACGRHMDAASVVEHSYPAHVPPHRGFRQGPRAGEPCPNRNEFDNRVVLGHRFKSEFILLAVDMPEFLDAPMMEASG